MNDNDDELRDRFIKNFPAEIGSHLFDTLLLLFSFGKSLATFRNRQKLDKAIAEGTLGLNRETVDRYLRIYALRANLPNLRSFPNDPRYSGKIADVYLELFGSPEFDGRRETREFILISLEKLLLAAGKSTRNVGSSRSSLNSDR
jgi:hypothetical protein